MHIIASSIAVRLLLDRISDAIRRCTHISHSTRYEEGTGVLSKVLASRSIESENSQCGERFAPRARIDKWSVTVEIGICHQGSTSEIFHNITGYDDC